MAADLEEQIKEIRRELAMRTNVYPSLVDQGKLTALKAIHQNEGLMGALKTLEWLQANAGLIKQRLS